MHTYQNFSDAPYWNGIRARLAPVVGHDIAVKLGDDWMDIFEVQFQRSDEEAAALALELKGKAPSWFVVEVPDDRLRDDDYFTAAHSAPEALADAVTRCEYADVWPDQVEVEGQRIRLLTAGAVILQIYPLAPAVVSATDAQRASSILTGLRRSATPAAELIKRINRWPGLSALNLQEEERSASRQVLPHLAVPSEWLLSARLLCEKLGIAEPSPKLIQEVAAAALNAPSWNHLAGPAAALGGASAPWALHNNSGSNEDGQVTFFTSAFEAFASLLWQLPQQAAGWKEVAITPYHLTENHNFGLQFAEQPRMEQRVLQIAKSMSAYPMEVAELEEKDRPLVSQCEAALAHGAQADVQELFRLSVPAAVRVRAKEQRDGEQLIAEAPGVRFVLSDDGVRARRYDRAGNRTFQVRVKTHKGALWQHPSGLMVLTCEYGLDSPVAVFSPLPEPALAAIQEALPRSRGVTTYYSWKGSPADQAIYAAAQALARGEAVDLDKVDLD